MRVAHECARGCPAQSLGSPRSVSRQGRAGRSYRPLVSTWRHTSAADFFRFASFLNFLRRFSFSSSARSFIAPRGRCLRRERVCASQCCLMRRCAQGAAWRAARAAHTPARLMGLLSPPYLPRPRIGELGGYFQMGGLQVMSCLLSLLPACCTASSAQSGWQFSADVEPVGNTAPSCCNSACAASGHRPGATRSEANPGLLLRQTQPDAAAAPDAAFRGCLGTFRRTGRSGAVGRRSPGVFWVACGF